MSYPRVLVMFGLVFFVMRAPLLADPPAAAPPKNIFDIPDKPPPNPPNPPAPQNTPNPPPATESVPPPVQPPPLLPMPSASQIAAARKNMEDLYSKEIADATKSNDKRLDLAEEMIAAGADQNADPNTQYVLLATGHDLAEKGSDLSLACRAIRLLRNRFDIDVQQHESATAMSIAKQPLPAPDRRMFVLQVEALAERMLRAGRVELVPNLDETARVIAASSGDAALIKQIKKSTQDHVAAKVAFDEMTALRKTLATDPKNGPANTALGRYLCLEQGDWAHGLPMLSAGSDPRLKQAADAELSLSPPAKNVIANDWWEIADNETEPARHRFQLHACELYTAALPSLQGLEKSAIGRRIAAVKSISIDPPTAVDLADLFDPTVDCSGGVWTSNAAGALDSDESERSRIDLRYCPPKEYDYRIVFTRLSGDDLLSVVCVGGSTSRQFSYVVGSGHNTVAGFSTVLGMYADSNPTTVKGRGVENGDRHTLVVRVRANSVQALIDDKIIGHEYRTDFRDLSLSPLMSLHRRDTLGLATWKSEYKIHSIRIVEMTGHGHLIQPDDPQDSPVAATATYQGPGNHHQAFTATMHADGAVDGAQDMHGTWSIRGTELVFRWGGNVDVCHLSADGKSFKGKTAGGDDVTGQITEGSL